MPWIATQPVAPEAEKWQRPATLDPEVHRWLVDPETGEMAEALLLGWWDGATTQPVRLRGYWTGVGIGPLRAPESVSVDLESGGGAGTLVWDEQHDGGQPDTTAWADENTGGTP